jgi:hypothetical protein
MSKHGYALGGLLRRLGVASAAKTAKQPQSFSSTSVKRSLLALPALVLASLAFTAAPALAAAPEAPITAPPAEVKSASAVLQGVVDPLKLAIVSWYFEYKAGAVCTGGSTTPVEGPAEVEALPVAAGVGGLTPGAEYAACLVSENEAKETTPGTPVIFTTVPTPVTDTPTPVAATTATLNGHFTLDATAATQYSFEYKAGSECTGGEVTPTEEAGTGTSGALETANIGGLTPGVQYTACFVTANSFGSEQGPPVGFTTDAVPPGVANEAVTNVEAYAATLNAEINPHGGATMYHFEYDTREYKEGEGPHGQSTPETSPGASDNTSHLVSAQLEGLHPSTTYYYRVVASNASSPGGGTSTGPGKTLTTFAPPGSTPAGGCANEQRRAEQPYGLDLPDCRAYEMVSPLDKGDQGVLTSLSRAAVSSEEPAITYTSKGSFGETSARPAGAFFDNRYVSRRNAAAGRWETQNITPPGETVGGVNDYTPYEQLLFSPDLSQGLVESEFYPLTNESPAGYYNFYTANFAAGSYKLVNTVEPQVPPDTEEYKEYQTGWPTVGGVSAKFEDVVYNQEHHVYESVDGHVVPVDVAPANATFNDRDNAGAGIAGHQFPAGEHVVSENGSRVFFTAGETHSQWENAEESFGQLYVRENPAAPSEDCSISGDACTVEISASQRTNGNGEPDPDPNDPATAEDPGGVRVAMFWGANKEGTKVFFTSRAELTSEANTGTEDNAANLYEYNVETKKLSDLSEDINPADKAEGAVVLGVVATSEDGAYVYFVAEGDLAGAAVSGKPNLYLYHAGSVSFIATLAASDLEDWWGGREYKYQPNGRPTSEEELSESKEAQNYASHGGPIAHKVRVTPDGRHLAFLSEQELTGYDNEQSKPGECEEGKCKEVFAYEAATGRLACASCDPSGARPLGEARFGTEGSNYYASRNWSEDGSRLFFQTPDPLVLHDTNGLQDVYEYENGQVFPISDVTGNYESTFLDASANGDDVFIATADRLLPSDTDTRADVYDARVGGGFPVSVAAAECENADSCKPPAAPQPSIFAPSGSATFAGAGNLTPAIVPPPKKVTKKTVKCKKNFVKNKKGKCVKRPKKKAKRAKKASHGGRTKS